MHMSLSGDIGFKEHSHQCWDMKDPDDNVVDGLVKAQRGKCLYCSEGLFGS